MIAQRFIQASISGPVWLSGGSGGLEASIGGLILVLASWEDRLERRPVQVE